MASSLYGNRAMQCGWSSPTVADVPYFVNEASFTYTDTPMSTGTSIVAIAYPGGVVLASDTRTSQGPFVSNRASRKIHALHHRIVAASSGSVAVSYAIKRILKVQLEQHAQDLNSPGGKQTSLDLPTHLPTVQTAAMLAKNPIYRYKDMLRSSFVIAGWDPKRGGEIYCVPLGGAMIKQAYTADGSGGAFMMSLLDSKYHSHLTKDECEVLAKQLIAHAIYRDSASGGMIRVVSITKDALEETVVDGNDLPFDS